MRRRRSRGPRILTVLVLVLLLAWAGGFVRFVTGLPMAPPESVGPADAIVVLTGGRDRLPAGIGLLQRGVAERMFVSGVYTGVDVATILDLNTQVPTTLACCIDLGHDAPHTVGNVRETANWMAAGGRRSMVLVTANYHMPRSLVLFRRLAPDIRITPYPVSPEAVRPDIWWRHPRTLIFLAGEYTEYLVSLAWPPA